LQEGYTLRNNALIVALAAKEIPDQTTRDFRLPLLMDEMANLFMESRDTSVAKDLLPSCA
jgi:hypothetical protein